MEENLIYVFSVGAILSGYFVINSTNPIHSVFGLVMCFVNSSILLLMLGVEFLALLFLIVYVGALAILFLFVVMMLNVRIVELIENSTRYIPIGGLVGIILILELLVIAEEGYSSNPGKGVLWENWLNNVYLSSGQEKGIILWEDKTSLGINSITNMEGIGEIIYTDGYIYLIISSIVLLVSMVGAIVMTLYHEEEVRRQDIFSQITTDIDLRELELNNSYKEGISTKVEYRLREK